MIQINAVTAMKGVESVLAVAEVAVEQAVAVLVEVLVAAPLASALDVVGLTSLHCYRRIQTLIAARPIKKTALCHTEMQRCTKLGGVSRETGYQSEKEHLPATLLPPHLWDISGRTVLGRCPQWGVTFHTLMLAEGTAEEGPVQEPLTPIRAASTSVGMGLVEDHRLSVNDRLPWRSTPIQQDPRCAPLHEVGGAAWRRLLTPKKASKTFPRSPQLVHRGFFRPLWAALVLSCPEAVAAAVEGVASLPTQRTRALVPARAAAG